jgi:hypothetical protein
MDIAYARAKAWAERNTWWISLVSIFLGLLAGGLRLLTVSARNVERIAC